MEKVSLEEIRQMIKEGDFDEAQGYLAQKLIDNPKDETAWLTLADIVPPEQAKESLERVLEINPDNNEARLRLAQLTNAPSAIEQTTTEEVLSGDESEQKPMSVGDDEDFDLDELIKSLEKNPEMLPATEPEMMQTTPGTTLNEDDSFLASVLEENPPEPVTDLESEPISIDDGSFFAMPDEEEKAEQPPPEPASEDDISTGAVPIETLPEQMTQIAQQDFSIAAEGSSEKKKEKKPPKKTRRKRSIVATILWILISLCVVVTGVFSWYYFYGPCGVEKVIAADQQVRDILKRWDDSMMVATNSSRIVLAEPLRRLVDIRQELNQLEIPVCMTSAHDSLDRSMLYTLEAYDKLFKYENDLEISKRFNMAKTQRRLYEQQMDAVRQCAPLFCP